MIDTYTEIDQSSIAIVGSFANSYFSVWSGSACIPPFLMNEDSPSLKTIWSKQASKIYTSVSSYPAQ